MTANAGLRFLFYETNMNFAFPGRSSLRKGHLSR